MEEELMNISSEDYENDSAIAQLIEYGRQKSIVTIDDILSPQRTQTLVTPRQLAMFLSRKLTTKSLQEIAAEFKKTHATVVHGARTIQNRIDSESELKKSVEEIVLRMGRKPSDILE